MLVHIMIVSGETSPVVRPVAETIAASAASKVAHRQLVVRREAANLKARRSAVTIGNSDMAMTW